MLGNNPDETSRSLEMAEPFLVELELIRRSLREAFGLAKGQSSALGYQHLCQGRDRAVRLPLDTRHRAELLRYWDKALYWYERFAPSPL